MGENNWALFNRIAWLVKVGIILQNGGCLEVKRLKRGICHMSRKYFLKVYRVIDFDDYKDKCPRNV